MFYALCRPRLPPCYSSKAPALARTDGADPGTRPGLHGQTLLSSGHPDLDRLLGGGLPIGSLLLLLEDGWSAHHATLLRYFLAEGAACGQVSCRRWLGQLPSWTARPPPLAVQPAASAPRERYSSVKHACSLAPCCSPCCWQPRLRQLAGSPSLCRLKQKGTLLRR